MSGDKAISKRRLAMVIDVSEIDELLDSGVDKKRFIGRSLRWHNGQLFPFVLLRNGWLGARASIKCHREGCRRRHVTYLVSGLHNGAWCYARSKRGEYEGNLRDEVITCAEHQYRDSRKTKQQ